MAVLQIKEVFKVFTSWVILHTLSPYPPDMAINMASMDRLK